MNQVPYNTGKVKIGCRYEPPKRSNPTAEDNLWSNVLLGVSPRPTHRSWKFWLYMVFYAFLLWSVANMG